MNDAEFQNLHAKLLRFFEWNRCASPQDLAQETILRGLRRLAEGGENYAENPQSFFLGIARNVLREEWKKVVPEQASDEDTPDRLDQAAAVEWRILLRECLSRLSRKDRDLIVGYILDGADEVARAFDISTNAARIRVLRIREKIFKSLHGPGN